MPQLGCKKPRAPRTHCFKGHELTPENTGTQKKHGKRFCKLCEAKRRHEHRGTDDFKARQRKYMADWRATNPERNRTQFNLRRLEKKRDIEAFKALVGCSRCPERHVACLDFHHKDPQQKSDNVSVALARWSLDRLFAEIEKCNVLCANCHRRLHWEERQQQAKDTP